MKEYGDYKSKTQADFEKHKEYMIGKGYDYICNTCKRCWYPTEEDISLKRPSCYYRGCRSCRFKSYTKAVEYKQKKGNNFNAMYANN
jgi:hypothetical protein